MKSEFEVPCKELIVSYHQTAVKSYTPIEEVFNSLSHGVGVLFGLIALVLLTMKALHLDAAVPLTGVVIYGMSIVFLFLASTLYHAIPHQPTKRVFKIIDHSAIYLLIAGSYTPFLLLTIDRSFGVVLMIVIWTLAVVGIIFKVFFVHRFQTLSLITYLGMGWLAVVASFQLIQNLPFYGLALLVGGGIAYSLGTIFFKVRRIPFNHAIWHVFVLVGSVFHFLTVYYFVLPGTR